MDAETSASDALSERIAALKKLFAKGLGHKPNRLQALAIARAARLSAVAEQALTNPQATANDITRLDNCASRARRDMAALLDASRTEREPTYDELMGAP
jgi:hypothetical protein